MTVAIPVPKVTFATAGATPRFNASITKRLVVFGVAALATIAVNTPTAVSSGSLARTSFGECEMTRIAESHFAQDPNRTNIVLVRLPTVTAGSFAYFDETGVTGTSVATVNSSPTPLGRYQLRIEVLTGGTIGATGIVLRTSVDNGRTFRDVELSTAVFVQLTDYGIRVNFAAGTLIAGDVIVGYTLAPRTDGSGLTAALTALANQDIYFQLLGLAEPLETATDPALLATGLTLMTTKGKDVHAFAAYRSRWTHTTSSTVTATFANANPDTLTRATGSWITDGVKPGMYVEIVDSISNDAIKGPIASVSATVITFAASVALVAEVATASVIVTAGETEAQYIANAIADTAAISDPRLTIVADDERVVSPSPVALVQDVSPLRGILSRVVIDAIQTDLGQPRANGASGGALDRTLQGRIYESGERIHLDADVDGALAAARFTVLRSIPDGVHDGAFVARGLTFAGVSDSIDTIVKARLANLWRAVVRPILYDFILLDLFADESDPNRISESAAQTIEGAVLAQLRTQMAGMVSNLNTIGLNALFTLDRDSDLTVAIKVGGKIITKLYPEGFDVTLTVASPGTV